MKCPTCFFTDREVSDETCRKCSRNFSRRELFEVVLLGILYLFLCRFSGYLFTGNFFSHPLEGGVFFPVRMNEIFTFPVSLPEEPWHILTVGWVFALVLVVPLLVGLFYGVVPGVIVALIGGYYVVAPFFFLLTLLGAMIAGTRVRNLLHLEASLLLGTVPALVYLFVLTLPAFLGETGIVAWLPWLVAIFFVTASVSPVLWLARRRDYDVKFLPWFVGAQVILILLLFHFSEGFAKIEYEFVRQRYWAGGPPFRTVVQPPDASHTAEQQHAAALALLESQRGRSLERFSRFLSYFPRSAESPRALFERAEIHNLRPNFTGTQPDMLRGYTDRISGEALQDYETIRTDFSESPVTLEARLRIGWFYLQHHQIDRATDTLVDLRDYCDVRVPPTYRPTGKDSVLLKWRSHRLSSEDSRRLLYEVLREARARIAFIQCNSDYDLLPLMLFCQLDPNGDDYEGEARKVLTWFDDCLLADNIKLSLIERRGGTLEEIEELLGGYPKGDVAPRMLWLLGSGYFDRLVYTRAETYLKRLVEEFPDAPEAEPARAMLAELTLKKAEGK